MSKRSTVQPIWLDVMLYRWGLYSLRMETNSLGFPKICVMLKDGIPVRTPDYNPDEITGEDYSNLQRHIEALDRKYQLVLIRAYRPWRAAEMDQELSVYDVTPRTFVNWLHAAAAQLHSALSRRAA